MAKPQLTNFDEMLTVREAADYLNVNTSYIHQLYRKGRLEGQRIGRDVWLTKASVKEHQKNRRPRGRIKGTKYPRKQVGQQAQKKAQPPRARTKGR